MEIETIKYFLKDNNLISEKLDDRTTFWCEIAHLVDKLKKTSANDFIELVTLSLNVRYEKPRAFPNKLEEVVGRKRFSSTLKLFCNIMRLYNCLTQDNKDKIDEHLMQLTEYLKKLQQSTLQKSRHPEIKCGSISASYKTVFNQAKNPNKISKAKRTPNKGVVRKGITNSTKNTVNGFTLFSGFARSGKREHHQNNRNHRLNGSVKYQSSSSVASNQ